MKADQIINSSVVDVAHGTTIGKATGLLVDADEKRVVAIAVSKGGMIGHMRYMPFENVIAAENDVVTIPSEQSLIERRNYRSTSMLESLGTRHVITENGREIGQVRDYSFDPKTGELQSIMFGITRSAIGGLWRSAGDTYEIPIAYVKVLGDHVVVDDSVPDIVGLQKAA